MQLCPATVLKCQEAIPISNNEMRKIHRGGEEQPARPVGRKVNVSQSRREVHSAAENRTRTPKAPKSPKPPKEKSKHPILRFIGRTVATVLCLGIMLGSVVAVGMVFYVVQATANDGDLLDLDNIQLSQSSMVVATDPANADLPIVGGSILSHDHFQGGHYTFAMAKAPIEKELQFEGFSDVKAGIVKWPMSVIRISGPDKERLIELADKILLTWRGYTDEDAFIYAETDGEPHNTITPIARRRGDDFELDLVLRNNITTEEHPLGVYHPHAKLHHIKKENIGLIEVMGLAVLPARLKDEMAELADALVNGTDLRATETLASHAEWAEGFLPKYDKITKDNVMDILHEEIGLVFNEVLQDAGVYKCTPEGRKAFERFIAAV